MGGGCVLRAQSFERGRLVISRQGRDKGRVFLVLETIDENYVSITDGETRKLSHPKRKKTKHLIPKPIIVEPPDSWERLMDSDVRKAIKAAMCQEDMSGNEEGCAFVKE